jgi:hypothetical protein
MCHGRRGSDRVHRRRRGAEPPQAGAAQRQFCDRHKPAADAAAPIIVARLTKPLEPGKSAKLAIKGKRGCLFDVRGAYADDATVENDGIDLCKDSKLRLNE